MSKRKFVVRFKALKSSVRSDLHLVCFSEISLEAKRMPEFSNFQIGHALNRFYFFGQIKEPKTHLTWLKDMAYLNFITINEFFWWRIWLRCYRPWLSFRLGVPGASSNPAVQFSLKFSQRLTQSAFHHSLPFSLSLSIYFRLSPSYKNGQCNFQVSHEADNATVCKHQPSDIFQYSPSRVHEDPSPVNPSSHVHSNDPSLFVHVALTSQYTVLFRHSSSSG